jgi:hypothetical protein
MLYFPDASSHSLCKALFDLNLYKLDCWLDCSQIVARLFTVCLCDLM